MQLKNQFKIRCSAIGQIMTDPKGKSSLDVYNDALASLTLNEGKYSETKNKETATAKKTLERIENLKIEIPLLKDKSTGINLSVTCISYIHKWIKEQPEFYGKSVGFSSKYTDKGISCENESIDFAAKYYGWGKVKKNTERKDNDYLIGESDVILPDSVEDIKNSWSQDTFPLFNTDIPIDGYGYQLQGYMELYNKNKSGLIYTLMDAPEWLIEKEAMKKQRELGLEDLESDLYEEVREQMTYSQYDDELRIKRFGLDRDKLVIERIYERVELCRKYIEQL